MIKSIKISNFQSHKKTFLKFKKGVNIISGKSDCGKSAIFRSFKWVLRNKPSGNSFKSYWNKNTGVEIKFFDNNILKRSKGKENVYTLNKKKYKSFGQDIPPPIKGITKISDINLQTQFSPPFLLTVSPGEISKYLNSLVNLKDIDISQSNIQKIIRKETQSLTSFKLAKKELEEDVEKYSWVEAAEKKIKNLNLLEQEILNEEKQQKIVEEVIQNIILEQRKLTRLQKIDIKKANCLLNEIEIKCKKMEDKNLCLNKIEKNIHLIGEEEIKILNLQKELKELNKTFKELFPNECPLCGRIK